MKFIDIIDNSSLSKKIKRIIFVVILLIVLGSIVIVTFRLNTQQDVAPEESEASSIPGGLDERWAGSGDMDEVKEMGVVWNYNWGWAELINYFNELYDGRKTLHMVGRPDHFYSVNDQRQCNLNPNDPNKPFLNLGNTFYPRFDANGNPDCGFWGEVNNIASQYPGGYWTIGNEPDLGSWGHVHPQFYARWYKKFADRILEVDPNAKISNGGLLIVNFTYDEAMRMGQNGGCSGPNWVACEINDTRVDQNNNIIYSPYYFRDNILSQVPEVQKSLVKNNAYAYWFVHELKLLYDQECSAGNQVSCESATNLPIHWWNIHPYPHAYWNDNDTRGKDVQIAVDSSKGQIVNFRNFMSFIEHEDRPLMITEFGIAHPPKIIGQQPYVNMTPCDWDYGQNPNKNIITNSMQDIECREAYGISGADQRLIYLDNYNKNTQYINGLVDDYLVKNSMVQRWHWFVIDTYSQKWTKQI